MNMTWVKLTKEIFDACPGAGAIRAECGPALVTSWDQLVRRSMDLWSFCGAVNLTTFTGRWYHGFSQQFNEWALNAQFLNWEDFPDFGASVSSGHLCSFHWCREMWVSFWLASVDSVDIPQMNWYHWYHWYDSTLTQTCIGTSASPID